jgi:methylphosphotriester-DNA--protein-cysteine methyltransferase
VLSLSRAPGPALSGFVERLWLLRDAPPHSYERILPSGTLELVVNVADNAIWIHPAGSDRPQRYSGAVVSGAYSRFFGIETRAHASMLGVHFKPGGAFPFLGVAARELSDRHVDLESLWGSGARLLRERLCSAQAPAEQFRILEDALRERLNPAVRRHPVVPYLLAQLERPDTGVRELAAHLQMSHRRLIEVFCLEVGMTPKLFSRIRRFEHAAARVTRASRPGWAQLALAAGYCDQSHLIGDFVRFSGFAPLDFVRHTSQELKEGHLLV